MTRKDTIIIASIINAVLLVVLFLTGVKGDSLLQAPKVEEKQAQLVEPVTLPPAPKKEEIKVAQGDEIDRVLREFSKKTVAQKEEGKAHIDFAKELEAITKTAIETKKEAPKTPQVVVKKGDVLEKIARANNTNVKELMELNNLRSTILQIGQKLKLPSENQEAKAEVVVAKGEYYTVKSGDSPWTIAVKNHLKVDELLRLNNLDEEKARQLKPGDQLRIR